MKAQINLGIVEDHNIVRKGLVSVLREYEKIKIVFDVANGHELLEKLRTTRPDIILMDIEMPVMDGKEAVEKLKRKYPKLKIIIMTAFPGETSIIEFVKKGVNSFLNKDYSVDELLEAIYSVNETGSYFDKNVSAILAKELAMPSESMRDDIELSKQDIEIIKLIYQGSTSKEIADQLNLSLKTIEFHRAKILRKTNSRNVSALLKYAIQNKLIKLTK